MYYKTGFIIIIEINNMLNFIKISKLKKCFLYNFNMKLIVFVNILRVFYNLGPHNIFHSDSMKAEILKLELYRIGWVIIIY